MILSFELLVFIILLILFSTITLKYQILQLNAVIVSLIIGTLAFIIGRLNAVLLMIAFVFFGELATRIARKIRKSKQHPRRALGNVIGNGGAALIALLLGNAAAFTASLSAALADTFSSEIGLLSKKKPRLITNPWKIVKPGTDGGVTILGFIAAFFGATIIALLAAALQTVRIETIAILILIGIVGSIIDSIIGAVFERRGLLNNTAVNFIASGSAAVLAAIFI